MPGTQTVSVLRVGGVPHALRLPRFRVRVQKGPDRRKERTWSGRRMLLGSGEAADLQLSDATVSALHCALIADETGIRVKDLGAKNGVLLDGRRVVEAYLGSREELRLGESVVRFQLLSEEDEQPLPSRVRFGRLLGGSARMRELYAQLERAAAADAPVLLLGETGSGKELAADALVSEGPRSGGPLVVLDCGALPLTLAESELFGHERGAFTGAVGSRPGAFERAHGGTLFLDEVGELPLALQV